MILSVLELVKKKMNESFGDEVVFLSNLVDHSGVPYAAADNKVVMFLANIKYETAISTYQPTVRVVDERNDSIGDERFASVAPPLYINIFILFLANFFNQNYSEGARMISRVISFFQQNPYFTHQIEPGLPTVVDKLSFEMVNLDITDLNYLMALSGTKYLPSVYYKVRLLPFDSRAIQAEVPPARGYKASGEPEDEIPDPSAEEPSAEEPSAEERSS